MFENDETVVTEVERDKEDAVFVAGIMEGLGLFIGRGWERLLMSSASLSSSTVVAGCCRVTGGQGWLGRHFTWNNPMH